MMKMLLLGRGVSNNALHQFLLRYRINHDFCDINEVINYDYNIVVKGPGLSYKHEIIAKFSKNNAFITDDIEIVYWLLNRYFIAVTGTNGKTTTVLLIEALLNQKYHAISCANIGFPFAQAAIDYKDYDYFVLELSSFELLATHFFTPKVAVILNLCEAHLDFHETLENYHRAKMKITINQSEEDLLIYNYDDKNILRYLPLSKAQKLSFALDNKNATAFYKGSRLYYLGKYQFKIKKKFCQNKGVMYDFLASFLVARRLNIANKNIKKVFNKFKFGKYRLNYLGKGIYNDAKSTNPYSTLMALETIKKATFLIAGGAYRKTDLSLLKKQKKQLKAVFLYGEAKEKIYEFFVSLNILTIVCLNLEEALKKALAMRKKEIILYSPMFPSYDQFKSFNERGALFNKLIKKLVK